MLGFQRAVVCVSLQSVLTINIFFFKQPREDYWAVSRQKGIRNLRSSLCIYSECILFVCTLLIALLNQLDCSVGVEPDPE